MKEEIIIENQLILTKIFNTINNSGNKANAYLLVGENSSKLKDFSIILSKILVCPNKYSKNCTSCNICKRIDENTFSEVMVITPENNVIKKEKVEELKSFFKTESIEGKNGVYIINGIDLLNVSSANAILKFLEEPDSNVVAIFNTTNLDKVIPTIASRCQVIKVNNKKQTSGIDFVKDLSGLEEDEIYDILSFVKKIELDMPLAFAEVKNKFIKQFDTKEKLKSALDVMLLFYKDILNYKVKNKCIYFEKNDLKRLSEINSNDVIARKISFLLENNAKIEYNVNVLLFMSNLLIGIGDIAR